MPLRLAELLERIRPTGTPGSPSEGEQQREALGRVRELAQLAGLIAEFEREADAIASTASQQSERLLLDAQNQARGIRSGIPERLAAVKVEAVSAYQGQDLARQGALERETAAQISRLQANAATMIPKIRASALETIWSIVPTTASPRSSS